MPKASNDLTRFPDLELSIEFQGSWETRILFPPPFTALCGECEDAPISLEVYALDPDYFRTAEDAARDLIRARLISLTKEEYTPVGEDIHVRALGQETDLPTEILARVFYDNDAFYVVAFSAWPGVLSEEQWRVEAMLASAFAGEHRSYGRGIKGIVNYVGAHLSESDVSLGRSRAHLGFLREQKTVRRGRPARGNSPALPEVAGSPKVMVDPSLSSEQEPVVHNAELRAFEASLQPHQDDVGRLNPELRAFEKQLRGDRGSEHKAPDLSRLNPELRAFDKLLRESPPPVPAAQVEEMDEFDRRLGSARKVEERVSWPAPWGPLPNMQKGTGSVDPTRMAQHRTRHASADRRAMEIFSFAEGMPAEVSFYAEKVFGVGESISYRDLEPFPVMGMDRAPLVLEALLRVHQRELDLAEPMAISPARRAPGQLGGELAEGAEAPLSDLVKACAQRDDHTAADMLGWRLGWRGVQERLGVFGLEHHSMILPTRARLLAFTREFAGPLREFDLETRIDLWRKLSADERRTIIGQIHKANLETSLEDLQRAFLEVMRDGAVSPLLKAQWSLALGARATAREYAKLWGALSRGELIGRSWCEQSLLFFKPCLGDHLSGVLPGVSLSAGKLGQAPGCLSGSGVLSRMDGGEVALCVLLKGIVTHDYRALVEQTRLLSAMVYEHTLSL